MVELLVVLIILSLLLAMAVPAYLTIADDAAETASKAQVRTVVPSLNQYMAEHGNSYAGVDVPTLKSTYDSSLNASRVYVEAAGGGTSFYACAFVKSFYAEQEGPRAPISVSVKDKTALPSGGGNCPL